jgi:hypothetical protein
MTKYAATIAFMGGICALALAAAATPASASGSLAFVSRTGGGSTCSFAAPCLAMNAALTVAGVNGEVICLDKGPYGMASILQSVTISCGDGLWEAPGTFIEINTPAGADVVIEGLVIDNVGISSTAIGMSGQGALHLRRVRVGNNTGSTSHGLSFTPNGPAALHLTDSVFYNNGGSGVLIKPTGSASVRAVISHTAFENNNLGITIDGTSSTGRTVVEINDSVVAGNSVNGITVNKAGTLINRTAVEGNAGNGILAGPGALIHLNASTAATNALGGLAYNGGQIFSYQNNATLGNGIDNPPSGVLTLN